MRAPTAVLHGIDLTNPQPAYTHNSQFNDMQIFRDLVGQTPPPLFKDNRMRVFPDEVDEVEFPPHHRKANLAEVPPHQPDELLPNKIVKVPAEPVATRPEDSIVEAPAVPGETLPRPSKDNTMKVPAGQAEPLPPEDIIFEMPPEPVETQPHIVKTTL